MYLPLPYFFTHAMGCSMIGAEQPPRSKPSPEDRKFVSALNELSKTYSSACFGDPGILVASKARRQLAFASAAWARWPDLGGGDLKTTAVEEWRKMSKVDTACAFWLEGQQRYLSILTSYMDALRTLPRGDAARHDLLSDLGFHMVASRLYWLWSIN